MFLLKQQKQRISQIPIHAIHFACPPDRSFTVLTSHASSLLYCVTHGITACSLSCQLWCCGDGLRHTFSQTTITTRITTKDNRAMHHNLWANHLPAVTLADYPHVTSHTVNGTGCYPRSLPTLKFISRACNMNRPSYFYVSWRHRQLILHWLQDWKPDHDGRGLIFIHVTFCTFLTFFFIFTFLWPPCIADADIIFCPVSIYLSFFFPRLISPVADCMCTILPHMVWP